MKLLLKKVDWLGLNHEVVREKFEGDLTFVNYVNVGEKNDLVAAVYHAAKPNTSKGHKEFVLLYPKYNDEREKEDWFVSGMDREQMLKHTTVRGVACLECKTAMYSLNRHHFHYCGCANQTSIDGGKDYLHYGAKDLTKLMPVVIDLITDEVLLDLTVEKE